jgi:hypothetical protein
MQKQIRSSGKFIAALVLSLGLNHSLQADAVVNQPTDAALRSAVASGGNITFSIDGAITLNSAIVINQNTTIDATSRSITINGAAATRLFEVSSGVQAKFISLNLVNGKFQPPAAPSGAPSTNAYGAAIFNQLGQVVLLNCVVSNNLALGGGFQSVRTGWPHGSALGGALYSQGGFVSATNCLFISNKAQGGTSSGSFTGEHGGHAMGGAITMDGGTIVLEDCRFDLNSAFAGPGSRPGVGGVAYGGAIFLTNQIAADISNSQIVSNTARGGGSALSSTGIAEGGALWNNGPLELSETIAIGNLAKGVNAVSHGGAIYNSGNLNGSRIALANNTALGGDGISVAGVTTDGFSGMGAGIFNTGALSITNSTFLKNVAMGGAGTSKKTGGAFGAGIQNSNGQVSLEYCTFAYNSTIAGTYGTSLGETKGTDLYFTNGTVNAHATIFASIANGAVFGTITDQGYNMAADNSAAFTSSTSLNLADPTFGPAAATYVPLAFGSPAINSGDPANFPATDQLGITRPKGSAPDRGAVEFNEIAFAGIVTSTPGTATVWIVNRNEAGYIIQQSTDLITWTEAARTNSTTGDPIEFNLPASQAGGTATFWRVISQP